MDVSAGADRLAYAVPPASVRPCVRISENRLPTMSVTFPMMSVTSFHSSGVNSSFSLGLSPHFGTDLLAFTLDVDRQDFGVERTF